MDVTVALELDTANVVDPLTPLKDAAIVELPEAKLLAIPGLAWPVDCTVAMVASEEVQLAELVTSLLEPSL
jgi:hypothetical protein